MRAIGRNRTRKLRRGRRASGCPEQRARARPGPTVMRFALLVLLAACPAHDVRVHFPSAPDAPTGTLVLQMSQAASDVSVAINGVLVVDDVHTQRIVIDGVPVGTEEVVMTANGAGKAFHTLIGADHGASVPAGGADA